LRNLSIINFFLGPLTLDGYPPVHRDKANFYKSILEKSKAFVTADVRGIWEGTLVTETAPAYQVYSGPFGEPRKVIQIVGSAPRLYDVELTITSQDEYRKFFETGPLVSTVSGQLHYVGIGSGPFSGFVDDTGLVHLIFYTSGSFGDQTFIGHLTSRGLAREISGNVMGRGADPPHEGPWAWAWINYYFSTLSVKKPGLGLSNNAYVVDYGLVF
jgi:hypothetical protein